MTGLVAISQFAGAAEAEAEAGRRGRYSDPKQTNTVSLYPEAPFSSLTEPKVKKTLCE